MINVSGDEFTVIFKADDKYLNDHSGIYSENDIENYFKDYVRKIDKELSLTKLLLVSTIEKIGVNGYTNKFTYGFDESKVIIAYNPAYPNLGLMVKFGASALKNYIYAYKSVFDKIVTARDIIIMLNNISQIRLSRFDIAIDYIDEGLLVDNIYRSIKYGNTFILNKRNSVSKIENFIGSEKVETLYFNKRSGRSFLRVYDKKKEQIDNNGDMIKKAIDCEDWTRFELELKKDYAHSLTEHILTTSDEQEYLKLLINSFIDCFKIKRKSINEDKEIYINTKYYNDLITMIDTDKKILTAPSRSKLSEYELKYLNLFNNGTIALFKMIKASYTDEEYNRFIKMLLNDIDEYELSREQFILKEKNKNSDPFF